MIGTDGKALVQIGSRYEIQGRHPWKFDGQNNNMYQTQHDELFASIRKGEPINDGEWMTNSTMLAVLVTMAAYSGKEVTWDQAFNSDLTWGPAAETYSLDMEAPEIPVANPGMSRIV